MKCSFFIYIKIHVQKYKKYPKFKIIFETQKISLQAVKDQDIRRIAKLKELTR
jgi:hypothetical protein